MSDQIPPPNATSTPSITNLSPHSTVYPPSSASLIRTLPPPSTTSSNPLPSSASLTSPLLNLTPPTNVRDITNARTLLRQLEDLQDSLNIRLNQLSQAITRLRYQAGELERSVADGSIGTARMTVDGTITLAESMNGRIQTGPGRGIRGDVDPAASSTVQSQPHQSSSRQPPNLQPRFPLGINRRTSNISLTPTSNPPTTTATSSSNTANNDSADSTSTAHHNRNNFERPDLSRPITAEEIAILLDRASISPSIPNAQRLNFNAQQARRRLAMATSQSSDRDNVSSQTSGISRGEDDGRISAGWNGRDGIGGRRLVGGGDDGTSIFFDPAISPNEIGQRPQIRTLSLTIDAPPWQVANDIPLPRNPLRDSFSTVTAGGIGPGLTFNSSTSSNNRNSTTGANGRTGTAAITTTRTESGSQSNPVTTDSIQSGEYSGVPVIRTDSAPSAENCASIQEIASRFTPIQLLQHRPSSLLQQQSNRGMRMRRIPTNLVSAAMYKPIIVTSNTSGRPSDDPNIRRSGGTGELGSGEGRSQEDDVAESSGSTTPGLPTRSSTPLLRVSGGAPERLQTLNTEISQIAPPNESPFRNENLNIDVNATNPDLARAEVTNEGISERSTSREGGRETGGARAIIESNMTRSTQRSTRGSASASGNTNEGVIVTGTARDIHSQAELLRLLAQQLVREGHELDRRLRRQANLNTSSNDNNPSTAPNGNSNGRDSNANSITTSGPRARLIPPGSTPDRRPSVNIGPFLPQESRYTANTGLGTDIRRELATRRLGDEILIDNVGGNDIEHGGGLRVGSVNESSVSDDIGTVSLGLGGIEISAPLLRTRRMLQSDQVIFVNNDNDVDVEDNNDDDDGEEEEEEEEEITPVVTNSRTEIRPVIAGRISGVGGSSGNDRDTGNSQDRVEFGVAIQHRQLAPLGPPVMIRRGEILRTMERLRDRSTGTEFNLTTWTRDRINDTMNGAATTRSARVAATAAARAAEAANTATTTATSGPTSSSIGATTGTTSEEGRKDSTEGEYDHTFPLRTTPLRLRPYRSILDL